MRVVKIKFEPIGGSPRMHRAVACIVNKPFSWCVEHEAYSVPMDIDCGDIERDNIPLPLFENWEKYGKDANGLSEIIPDYEDLDTAEGAHGELRLYGTLKMVEVLDRTEYEAGEQGLLAYLQFLLKTTYVSSIIDFNKDMMPAAVKAVPQWDKETIYRFVANVMGKTHVNVSVADVAHVIRSLTGRSIDLSVENFNLLAVAAHMPVGLAAHKRPDEFFTSVFPGELVELDVIKKYLTVADDGFYFGKGATYPINWGVNGGNSVLWKATVHRMDKKVNLVWAPMAGTLLERAIESKKTMFPELDNTVPFEIALADTNILDGGTYEAKPKDFNTGLRYLSVDQSLQVIKVAVPPTDISTIQKEAKSFVGGLPADADMDEVVKFLTNVYDFELNGIDSQVGDRHFMVYQDSLADLAESPDEMSDIADQERSTTIKRLEDYVLPGKPGTIRSILTYAWVLKHMDNEALCFVQADNDDFSVESAIEYVLDLTISSRRPSSIFLINCAYSDSVGYRKQGTMEAVGVGINSAFDIF